ncbi:unnamed protein product [Allacma fusca]|uniref:Uncharacterized protein n=1 Tax=Allacma fusca TaxID=39272 RepID=A0A8J2JBT8_9HEXA|nr:unnamed protein product [Allacma fusca]
MKFSYNNQKKMWVRTMLFSLMSSTVLYLVGENMIHNSTIALLSLLPNISSSSPLMKEPQAVPETPVIINAEESTTMWSPTAELLHLTRLGISERPEFLEVLGERVHEVPKKKSTRSRFVLCCELCEQVQG